MHIEMVKLKVKVTLEQATKPRRGVELYLHTFFDVGARWGWWSTLRLSHFTPGKDPALIA
jgi:hypothetical protein